MLPTLAGRIQTRIALLAVIGGLVTVVLCPVLPVSAPLADRYRNGFVVLAAVAVLGIGWELIYHFLMQWRWEKDWPTLFGLITLVPEGLLLWLLLLCLLLLVLRLQWLLLQWLLLLVLRLQWFRLLLRLLDISNLWRRPTVPSDWRRSSSQSP